MLPNFLLQLERMVTVQVFVSSSLSKANRRCCANPRIFWISTGKPGFRKTTFLFHPKQRNETINLAARVGLLDLLSSKRDSTLSSGTSSGSRLSLHSGLDLTGHGKESLLDIRRSLGRCFKEFDSKAISKFLSLFGGNNTLARQIGLVTYKKLVDILRGISIDFMQPLFHIIERLLVRYIINDDNSVRPAVVRGGNGTETFLSGCIPNLKLDGLSVKFDGTDFLQKIGRLKKMANISSQGIQRQTRTGWRQSRTYKIDSDSGDVGFSVGIIGKSKQQTRLPDTGISDEEQFKEVIAVKGE